jgi:hypothetical protein
LFLNINVKINTYIFNTNKILIKIRNNSQKFRNLIVFLLDHFLAKGKNLGCKSKKNKGLNNLNSNDNSNLYSLQLRVS